MPTKDNVFTNVNERIFYISDDIDNSSIGIMCFNLLYILQQDDIGESIQKDFIREPIKIFIDSNGGSIYNMWSLIDIMLNSRTPIYTYCIGHAFSAGCKIFLAGHKRFMSEHATLLYHQLSSVLNGKYQDLLEDTEENKWLQNKIEDFMMERTKITKKKLQDIRERKIDYIIHIEEALKLGFADEIYRG